MREGQAFGGQAALVTRICRGQEDRRPKDSQRDKLLRLSHASLERCRWMETSAEDEHLLERLTFVALVNILRNVSLCHLFLV